MGRPDYSSNVTVANEYTLLGTGTLFGRLTVGAAAVEVKVGAAALANRKIVSIQAHPDNAGYIYIGFDNTVTDANYAFVLSAGSMVSINLDASAALEIYAIASAADQYVGVVEGVN